jgi:sigma-E factor negative regulatory protein RseC
MIEQKAQVIQQEDGAVWVEAERQSTCSQCQVKNGCGTGLMAKHVGQRFSRLRVDTNDSFQAGQTVAVHIHEQALLSGAFLVYIWPLLMLFVASALCRWMGFGELAQIIVGLFALLFGFVLAGKQMQKKQLDIDVQLVEERE